MVYFASFSLFCLFFLLLLPLMANKVVYYCQCPYSSFTLVMLYVDVSGAFSEWLCDCGSRDVCIACISLVLSLNTLIFGLLAFAFCFYYTTSDFVLQLGASCVMSLWVTVISVTTWCVCVCQNWVDSWHSSILNLQLYSTAFSLHLLQLSTFSTKVMFFLLRYIQHLSSH